MRGSVDAYRGDAPVVDADRAHAGAQVVFYQLTRKFVDDSRSVPDDAQNVLYYTLSVGHHTGVIDCFEERVRCPLTVYEDALGLINADDKAYYKLAGILRGGEVQIEQQHTPMLLGAVDAMRARLADDASADDANGRAKAAAEPALDEVRAWLDGFAAMLDVLAADRAAYIMGRRREA